MGAWLKHHYLIAQLSSGAFWINIAIKEPLKLSKLGLFSLEKILE